MQTFPSVTRACSSLVLSPYSKTSIEDILLGLIGKLKLVQRSFLTLGQVSIVCGAINTRFS